MIGVLDFKSLIQVFLEWLIPFVCCSVTPFFFKLFSGLNNSLTPLNSEDCCVDTAKKALHVGKYHLPSFCGPKVFKWIEAEIKWFQLNKQALLTQCRIPIYCLSYLDRE